jgi:hypothetical protein
MPKGEMFTIIPEAREVAVLALTPEEKEILERLPVKLDEESVLELKRIAQTIAGDLGMKVKLGEPEKGSFFNPQNGEVTLDPLHIAENPEMSRMVAAHEGAHRRLTRGPKTLGVKPELMEELFDKATGFAYISNAIEDPTVNNWTKKEFEGLRGDFDKTYSEMLAKEHIPLGLDHPEVQAIVRRTGTVPNFVWVGSELIRAWQTGKFSKSIKKIRPSAAEVLGKVFLPAKRAYETLPEYAYDESRVIEAARERFKIIYQEIWPRFEHLILEDKENEARRKMVEEQMKQELQQKGTEGLVKDLEQGKTGAPLDNLPKDLRKELAKAMKKAFGAQEKSLEWEAKDIDEEAEKLEREAEAIEKEKNDLEKKKEEHGKAAEREITKRENIPLEMNDLSEELKEELKKIFEKLPPKERERLRQEAKKTLQDLEDKLNETVESKMNPDKPESHAEFRERQKQEDEEKRQSKEREREFEETKKAAIEIAERAKTEYDKIRVEMDEVIEDLYERLESFFTRERHPKWRKGYRAGPRLSLFRAMQFASGAKPEAYREMWERKTVPTRFEYKFTFLVDLSGSMRGEKIHETFRGVIVLTEVLHRLGIDFEIIGFQDVPIRFKTFDQDFDEVIQQKILGMPLEVGDKNPGGNNQASYNSDGYCLKQAAKSLREHAGKDNFLVVFSDGLPEPDGKHSRSKYDLKKISNSIIQEGDIKLVGLGLGPDTEHVKKYYPTSLPNIRVKDLPETLGNLLEEMITNPELFEVGEETKERFLGGKIKI